MILDIAHVGFTGDRVRAFEELSECGYRLRFSQDVRPMAITRRMLASPAASFRMSFWEREGAVSIEVLEFERTSSRIGLVRPLLSAGGDLAEPGSPGAARAEVSPPAPVSTFLGQPARSFQGPVHGQAGEGGRPALAGAVLAGAVLATPDLARSIRYWEGLGFGTRSRSERGALLRFPRRLAGGESLLWLEPEPEPGMDSAVEDVDSPGFHVLGFVSHSARSERERFLANGSAAPTEVDSIEVNGRSFDVFYTRSPEGVVVEVLSLAEAR